MLLYAKTCAPKVPKSRSRAGCTHCKDKKKKCDELRPRCSRCVDKGFDCLYSVIKPRQRRATQQQQSGEQRTPQGPVVAAAAGLERGDVPGSPAPFWDGILYPGDGYYSPGNSSRRTGSHPSAALATTTAAARSETRPTPSTLAVADVSGLFDENAIGADPPLAEEADEETTLFLSSCRVGDEDAAGMLTTTTAAPTWSLPHRYHNPQLAPVAAAAAPLSPAFFSPDAAATAAMGSPWHLRPPARAFGEFPGPPHRRALVAHFCGVLSHLIVLHRGGVGRGNVSSSSSFSPYQSSSCSSLNPFQRHVLPLAAAGSQAVANAVYTLASAHLECRGVRLPESSADFHSRANRGIMALLSAASGSRGGERQLHKESSGMMSSSGNINTSNAVNKDELLAAIMLLVYYEALVNGVRSDVVGWHLKGVSAIMATSENQSPVGQFLERAFRFYDVITALSLGRPPVSTAPALQGLEPIPCHGQTGVDVFLGMATPIWPLIHRLSALTLHRRQSGQVGSLLINEVSHAAAATGHDAEFEAKSRALESALHRWQPGVGGVGNMVAAVSLDDESQEELRSLEYNALAYKHSALVHLYRSVQGRAADDPEVQRHARESLLNCLGAVTHRGPMGALLWPLFVAACEIQDPGHRDVAERTFAEIRKRQGMINIEHALRLVHEVWRRTDALNECEGVCRSGNANATRSSTELWRDISAQMGISVIFG